MAKKRLLLYGRSVILGTVGASLQRCPTVQVISLSPPLPELSSLMALAPDVIVFDVEATRPADAFPLLEGCPKLLLIGVNPTTDRVLVWSGSPMNAPSSQALIDVINQQIEGPQGNGSAALTSAPA